MYFEPIEMITHGTYDNYHFDGVKGRFNGWNLSLLLNCSKGVNVTRLNDKEAMARIETVLNDFTESRSMLENESCKDMRIAVEAPDGLTFESEAGKVDSLLKERYGRGIWESTYKEADNSECKKNSLGNQENTETTIAELNEIGETKSKIMEALKRFERQQIRVRILDIPTTSMNTDTENVWVLDMVNKSIMEVYANLTEEEIERREKRRQQAIEKAKAARREKGGRKPIPVNQDLFQTVYRKWKAGEMTALEAMDEVDLKPNTFYRRVRAYEASLQAASESENI